MMSAKLTVPLGTFVHWSAGEMPVEMLRGPLGGGVVAAQVYFVGMVVRSAKDVLEISSDGGGPGGGVAGVFPCCAIAGAAHNASQIPTRESCRTVRIIVLSSSRRDFKSYVYFV
jgi:hypothetical protein